MWTTDIPKETGYYWHRWDLVLPYEVCHIEIDDENEPCMTRCGLDVPYASFMGKDSQIDGEFWPIRITLTPP